MSNVHSFFGSPGVPFQELTTVDGTSIWAIWTKSPAAKPEVVAATAASCRRRRGESPAVTKALSIGGRRERRERRKRRPNRPLGALVALMALLALVALVALVAMVAL